MGQVTDEFARIMREKEKEQNANNDDDEDGQMVMSKSGRICCTSLTEGIQDVRNH